VLLSMKNKFTGYLPTDTEIADIAVKFNFKDKIELRYGINNAYWQLKIFSYTNRSIRDPSILIEELSHRCKEMSEILSRLSTPELSCMEDNHDGNVHKYLYDISNDIKALERLSENTLKNIPSTIIIAKKIPVWWFVWELADLWKAEIKSKPQCHHSVINGYTGAFYRFVVECASLNGNSVYVPGSLIKEVLKKWHEDNPMYLRKGVYE
jgi:hypothetical protein